jgi:hypothetical protein
MPPADRRQRSIPLNPIDMADRPDGRAVFVSRYTLHAGKRSPSAGVAAFVSICKIALPIKLP